MQMAVMEKRAETSEKYICQIAKTIGRNNNNNMRKRDGTDNNDESSGYNDNE
jgi:hypothetical protein